MAPVGLDISIFNLMQTKRVKQMWVSAAEIATEFVIMLQINPHFNALLSHVKPMRNGKHHMGSNCFMDVYQYKPLIKHLIKSIMISRDQQRQLFYGLSVHLSTPVCFSKQQLKSKMISTDASLKPFYIIVSGMTGVSLCLHHWSLFDQTSDSKKQ